MMSAKLVTAIFAVFTVACLAEFVRVAGDAFAEPTVRAMLVAGFWLLKTSIMAAFAYFVAVRPPSRRQTRAVVAIVACVAAALGAVALQGPTDTVPLPMLMIGELVAVVASIWLLVSVLALGRCFGILPEARGLVTRGPYRLVRHPVYLGELGVCAGLVVGAPSFWNLACAAVILAAQIVRMGLEERALEAEFPAYAAYARRTARIVPWPSRRRFSITSTSPQEA
jgi:protein-S-isoprenylcysteine O-methyltransferase Ste14